MARTEVIMPQMGESIAEGTVVRWFKAPGDAVERDENLLEIATDKVEAEIPSPASGTLAEVLVAEGTTVEVGVVLGYIETEAADAPSRDAAAASGASRADAPTSRAPAPTRSAAPAASPSPATGGGGGGAVDIPMPQMGESIVEGTVVRWLKAPGDAVERDENLLEIATDKVEAEIPSPASGTLAEILVAEGETVEVGVILGRVATAGRGAQPGVGPQPAAQPGVGPQPAAQPGVGPQPAAQPGVGPQPAARGFHDTPPTPEHSADELRRLRSTPLVRKIAAEHDIDLRQLQGSGLSGRVTKRDILAHLEGQPAAGARPAAAPRLAPTTAASPRQAPIVERAPLAAAASGQAPIATAPRQAAGRVAAAPRPQPAAPDLVVGERDRLEAMTPMRRSIAEHMLRSRQTSPHAQTVHEVDFTQVVRARAALKPRFAERGVHLTYTAFIVKACVDALVRYPIVNSSVAGDQVLYRGEVNIGVAVALESGLVVPVIRGADELNLLGLARAINDLAERARTKRLKPSDLEGGTFTVTNPGVFGSLFGVPIINQPQVAILGCGAVKKRLVVDDQDQIAIRPIGVFCLSFDHRAVDGAVADHFMVAIKQSLARERWDA